MNTTEADQDFKDWFSIKVDEIRPMIENTIKTGDQLEPSLLTFSPTNQVAIMFVELNTPEDKAGAIKIQQILATDTEKCAGSILMFESWVVTRQVTPENKDTAVEDLKDIRGKSLEFHPGRQEGICMSAMRGGMQLMAMSIIDRETGTLRPATIVDVNAPGSPAQGTFIPGNTPPDGRIH